MVPQYGDKNFEGLENNGRIGKLQRIHAIIKMFQPTSK